VTARQSAASRPPDTDSAASDAKGRLLILSESDDPHALRIREVAASRGYDVYIWDSSRVHTDLPVALMPDGSARIHALNAKDEVRVIEGLSGRDIVLLRRLPRPEQPDGPNRPALERTFSHFIQGFMLLLCEATRMEPNFLCSFRSERKLYQLQIAARVGLHLPDTVAGNDAVAAMRLFDSQKRVCFKPIKAEGWISPNGRPAMMPTRRIDAHELHQSTLLGFPGIFQSALEKDFEVRAIITSRRVLAARQKLKEVHDTTEIDWRLAPERFERSMIEFPADTLVSARRLLSELGLIFGIFDFAICNERWYFLEVNPFGNFLNLLPGMEASCVEAILESLENSDRIIT